MALLWGAMIGGTATLLGGARAPLALGICLIIFLFFSESKKITSHL